MSFLTLLPAIVALGICLVPVLLLRRPDYARAQDYFVSSQSTPPEVVRNSSVASALRLAMFAPLLAWGASGDVWPALVAAAGFAAGLYLLYSRRRPMLEFMDAALAADRSITVHAFIARQHGDDPRVRLLAACLTLFALFGLILAEAAALGALLQPLLPGNAAAVDLTVSAMLVLMLLYTIPSGNSGAMQSGQMQLGMIYFGLFGSGVILLYFPVSEVAPMPPHAVAAVVGVAVFCPFIIGYRLSRYVETALLRKFGLVLNICITLFAIWIFDLAAMAFYSSGIAAMARDSLTALQSGTRVPGLGLLALVLLPLVYPFVDVRNWQRIAAGEKDITGSSRWPVQRLLKKYMVESPLLWLFVWALGAIALVATEAPQGGEVLKNILARLLAENSMLSSAALALLLVGVFAIAASTMSSSFAASLCTIRYDVLPICWPEPKADADAAQKAHESRARRVTLLAGVAFLLALIAAFFLAFASSNAAIGGSAFLAGVFAVCCAQVSLAPLLLAPILRGAGGGTVSPPWAVAVLVAGMVGGAIAVTAYIATGYETWLWAAVPLCLACGLLVFAVARRQNKPRVVAEK